MTLWGCWKGLVEDRPSPLSQKMEMRKVGEKEAVEEVEGDPGKTPEGVAEGED